MSQISSEWLKAANDDLILICEIINNESLPHLVAFHAQQAIEKSLKALLEKKNLDIPKIHSLNRLFQICKELIEIENSS